MIHNASLVFRWFATAPIRSGNVTPFTKRQNGSNSWSWAREKHRALGIEPVQTCTYMYYCVVTLHTHTEPCYRACTDMYYCVVTLHTHRTLDIEPVYMYIHVLLCGHIAHTYRTLDIEPVYMYIHVLLCGHIAHTQNPGYRTCIHVQTCITVWSHCTHTEPWV